MHILAEHCLQSLTQANAGEEVDKEILVNPKHVNCMYCLMKKNKQKKKQGKIILRFTFTETFVLSPLVLCLYLAMKCYTLIEIK